MLTPLPALYPPTHIATLSIYLAIEDSQIKLPEAWWELFDVSSHSELLEMARVLKDIYPEPSSLGTMDQIWFRVSDLPVSKEGVRQCLGRDTRYT